MFPDSFIQHPSEEPLTPCEKCGVMQLGEEHDHRPMGTLTPEQALTHWREYASKSGQSHGQLPY